MIEQIYLKTYFLINFKSLKDDEIIKKFIDLLAVLNNSNKIEENLKTYCDFVESLGDRDFSAYLKEKVSKIPIKTKNEEKIMPEIEIIKELSKINLYPK